MKISNEVKECIETAKAISEKMGSKSTGLAHIAKAMMENKRFKDAYEKVKKSNDLEILLDAKIKTYTEDEGAIDGLDRYASMALKIILNSLVASYRIPGGAGMTMLFLAVYSDICPIFSGLEILSACKVDKDLLFAELYKSEEKELGMPEDGEDVIVDIALKDMKPVRMRRDVGSFDKIVKAKSAELVTSGTGAESVPEGEWQKFVYNMNEQALKNDKSLIGRDKEIERIYEVLSKKEKSNPMLVGEPGVGKTAVVREFAKRINEKKVPATLAGSTVFELNVTALTANAVYRGQLEARLNAVMEALSSMRKPILFIDEIHRLIGGAGGTDSSDVANMLKTSLIDGQVKFIGSTTYDEYMKYIDKDPAFQRRFNKVDIVEPSEEDAIKIVSGLKNYYETFHKVKYSDKAIESSVRLTAKYIHDKFLPDKAIDLVDEAGAWLELNPDAGEEVTENIVSDVFSNVYNISKKTMTSSEISSLKMLPASLKARVFGQQAAVDEVAQSVQIAKSGLGDTTKPIASFLFVGPSGVGKTELAKQVADVLGVKFLRFDMSEYSDKYSVSKLFGTSAGFIGYEDGGVLTKAVSRNPECVLLLDEIEKADKDVYKTFLQIMDYGMLTDGHGKQVDFKNAIIIMTSNAGIAQMSRAQIGFGKSEVFDTSAIDTAVKETFSVEFRNRLTKVIKFNGLTEEASMAIINKELDILANKMLDLGYKITFDKSAKREILDKGVTPQYGAREIQRYISEHIKSLIVNKMIDGDLESPVTVVFKDGSYELELIPVAVKA